MRLFSVHMIVDYQRGCLLHSDLVKKVCFLHHVVRISHQCTRWLYLAIVRLHLSKKNTLSTTVIHSLRFLTPLLLNNQSVAVHCVNLCSAKVEFHPSQNLCLGKNILLGGRVAIHKGVLAIHSNNTDNHPFVVPQYLSYFFDIDFYIQYEVNLKKRFISCVPSDQRYRYRVIPQALGFFILGSHVYQPLVKRHGLVL